MSKEEREYSRVIRSNYAAMDNDSLLNLWNESHGLTREARKFLEQELANRGLLRNGMVALAGEMEGVDMMSLREKYSKPGIKGFWQLIANAKLGELPDEIIADKLQHNGLTETEARFMIQHFPSYLIEKINDADSDRLGALIRLCCGIAILIITLLASLGNGMYFIGWMTIALSIVQTAIASSKKSRLQVQLNQNRRFGEDGGKPTEEGEHPTDDG